MKPSMYNIFIPVSMEKYILYNTLSGATFLLDDEGRKIIQEAEVNKLSTGTINELKKNGILIEDHINEINIYSVLRESYKYSGKRSYFCIYMTYDCNLCCPYCYLEYFMRGKPRKMMENKTILGVTRFIRNFVKENNVRELIMALTGGEPLLNVKGVFSILKNNKEWTDKEGIEFKSIIFSNGTLFTKDVIKRLACHDVFIQITLAGNKETHNKKRMYENRTGTYDDIMKTITMLEQGGIDYGIRVDVDKENIDTLGEMMDDLRKRFGGGLFIKFHPILPGSKFKCDWTKACLVNSELKHLTKLWYSAKARGFNVVLNPLMRFVYCEYFTNRSYIIDPFGDVYKCGGDVGIKERKIGSIDINGKLVNPTYRYFEWMSIDPPNREKCRLCPLLPACGGGCSGVAYDKYGTYDKEDCRERYWVYEKIKFYLKDKIHPLLDFRT